MDKFLQILGVVAELGANIALPGIGGQIVGSLATVVARGKEQFDLEAANAGVTPDQLGDQVVAELRLQLPATRQHILDRMAETRAEAK